MPTLPHEARSIAESFGSDPGRYDRTRPGYPRALIAGVVEASPGRDVLDVGCGTGIAARQLQTAGATVLGIEPDRRMADFARASGVEVEVATFEEWDPAGRTFGAVTAATAWHWVDPVAGAVKAADVLRPGGLLAVFGHAFELPPDVQSAADAAGGPMDVQVPRAPGGAVHAYERLYASAAEGIRRSGEFGVPRQRRDDWQRVYTRDAWLEQLPTHGVFTRLGADDLRLLRDRVGAAIDAAGGEVTVTYATVVVTAVRRGTA